MTPTLHPMLVNGPYGDPALYVDFLFERRALLLDAGDLHALAPRQVLRVGEVFVSHTHIDHFIGFDRVLRLFVGREARLRLFGPAGFIDRVEARLGGYSWNLAHRFTDNLVFDVTEVRSDDEAATARFSLTDRFARRGEQVVALSNGVLFRDHAIEVRATILDHHIPCLAFAVAEHVHVNVLKNRLEGLGLAPGPWLRTLKEAILAGAPDETRMDIGAGGRTMALGDLKRSVVKLTPGQKLGYVVDAGFTDDNVRRIVALARDCDTLYIEAAFAAEDAERAYDRRHLTSEQAGMIAGLANVRRLEPFHFSPRYEGQEERLRREVAEGFRRGRKRGKARA